MYDLMMIFIAIITNAAGSEPVIIILD